MLLYYLAVINTIGLAAMGWDKRRAVENGWRVPEKTLMLVALVGGSVGVLLGMRWFRHKTRHPKFYIGVPAILVVQAYLLYRLL